MRFSSEISLWWIIPILGMAIFLSLWLYSRKTNSWVNELSKSNRIVLITLRILSLFTLGVLLLGIIFQAFIYKNEKPILLIGIDDSISMKNYRDSSKLENRVLQLFAGAKEKLSDQFDIQTYHYSNIPEAIIESKIKFDQQTTNLNQAFESTYEQFYNRNLAAILLVSDGNYNIGGNPIYALDKFTTTSVFTLGVGDTIAKRDQLIKHVSNNDVAFLKNDFPVVVDIEGIKMGKTSTEVSIEQNGNKLATQTVQFKDGTSDYEQVTFMINASSPGIQQYTIKLTSKDNEFNYENNTRIIYVDVIDSRSKVLFLSESIHPDIAAMKSVWEKDQNLEVEFKLLSDWNKDLKNVDLIVWYEPGLSNAREYQKLILENSISKLFVVGSQSIFNHIQELNISLDIPSSKNLDDYQASVNTSFNFFTLTDATKNAINSYPPIKAKFGRLKIAKDASILLNQRVGPVSKPEPLLYFATANSPKGSYKYGVFFGEGIWRWRLNEYAKNQSTNAFDELFSKIGQYLMVKQNTEPFRVTMPKSYSPNENTLINATVLNAALDPITTVEVHFHLTDEKGKLSKLQFGALGDFYQLNLGKLEAGKYSWKAFTTIDGKYREKKGEFIVKPLYLEQADYQANHNLLRQIAKTTNGSFYQLDQYEQALDEISKRDDLTSISYQETSFNELIEYFFIFLLLFVSLATEWFLRRYWGSY